MGILQTLKRLFRRRAIESPPVTFASAEELWRIKREQQDRDRAALSAGTEKPEDMLLLRPERLQSAKAKWPKGSLNDEE
jgi:hypothetical protein